MSKYQYGLIGNLFVWMMIMCFGVAHIPKEIQKNYRQ